MTHHALLRILVERHHDELRRTAALRRLRPRNRFVRASSERGN